MCSNIKQNTWGGPVGSSLFTYAHLYPQHIPEIGVFVLVWHSKSLFILTCIDVPNRASVAPRGRGGNVFQPESSSLNLIDVQASRHCRNSSVRAVRLCEKCGEIVSRRMEHSVGSESPKKQKTSRKGGLLFTVRSPLYSTRHLSVKFSYPHFLWERKNNQIKFCWLFRGVSMPMCS